MTVITRMRALRIRLNFKRNKVYRLVAQTYAYPKNGGLFVRARSRFFIRLPCAVSEYQDGCS